MRNIIAGLDVGSSRIKAVAGEILGNKRVNILGISSVPSAGMRRGTIIDVEATASSIDAALNELEHLAGIEVNEARVCFSTPGTFSFVSRAAIAVSNPGGEILASDVERLLRSTRMINIPPTHSVVHVIPRRYCIDGIDGVRDPAGMIGHRLEGEVLIIAVTTTMIQNLLNTLNRVGLKVTEIMLSPILAAEAVLTPAEKEMGVAIVDFGGGTTDITVYMKGAPVFVSVLPVGGEHITNDLAIGLKTTTGEARTLKEKHGRCTAREASDQNLISVSSIYGKQTYQVSEQQIAEMIEARVEEVLQMIGAELQKSGWFDALTGGVVFTGGSAKLRGIEEMGEEYLKINVRAGMPENIWGVLDYSKSPEYAAVIGSLIYGTRVKEMSFDSNRQMFSFSKYFEKILDRFLYLLR